MSERADIDVAIQLAVGAGLTQQQVIQLLHRIQAPPSMVGLLPALVLLAGLARNDHVHEEIKQIGRFQIYRRLLDALESPNMPAHWRRQPQAKPHLVHGKIDTHPVYAALLTPSVHRLADSAVGQQAIAVFTAFAGEVIDEHAKAPDFLAVCRGTSALPPLGSKYSSSIRTSGRALRNCDEASLAAGWFVRPDANRTHFVGRVDREIKSRTRIDDATGGLQRAPEPGDTAARTLAHLVLIAEGLREPREFSGRTSSITLDAPREPQVVGDLLLDVTPLDDYGIATTISSRLIAPGTDPAADDIAPGEREFTEAIEIDLTDGTVDASDELSQASAAGFHERILGSSRGRHIARSLHALVTSLTYVTSAQVEAIRALLADSRTFDDLTWQTAFLAHALVATGRSAESCALTGIGRLADAPSAEIEYLLDQRCWRISVPPPAFDCVGDFDITICRQHAESMLLPDQTGAFQLIPAGVEKLVSGDKLLGPTRPATLTKSLRRKLKSSYPTLRLRPETLMRIIRQLLFELSGDAVIPAIISGARLHNSETSLHYSTVETRRVEHVYREAMRPFLAAGYSDMINSAGVHVGSRFCPTDDFLRCWIARAVDALRQLRRKDLVRFHNAYALYTAQLLAHTCAMRATIDPRPDLIDPVKGLVASDDKSKVAGASTRVIPIVHVAVRQVTYFDVHRAGILRHITPPDVAPRDIPYLFLIDAHGQIVPLRPSDLYEAPAPFTWPIPQNSLRRHVRTRLMELDVDGQVIDAYMGHWRTPLSPHDALSSFDPQHFFDQCRKSVAQITCEVGWQPVRGWPW